MEQFRHERNDNLSRHVLISEQQEPASKKLASGGSLQNRLCTAIPMSK